jgi:GntR family transcriptional repressor for pyruvate dehydrogenase complex
MDAPVAKIEKVSTVDAIVNYLKRQIETGAVKPGDRLPSERILQKQLDVSRFALREALAKLSALGIIRIAHGKGAFVSTDVDRDALGGVFIPLLANHNLKHLADFFEARVLIESEAAMLCALRRSDEDIAGLKRIIDQSRDLLDDPSRYAEQDYLFHNKISQVSGNTFINKMLECINDFVKEYLITLAKSRAARERSLANHLKILESIRNRDAEKAAKIIREHLNHTFTQITGLDPDDKRKILEEDLNKIVHLARQES